MGPYYYIKSSLNGLYVDVDDSKTNPGAIVSTWKKNGNVAQQWWDDIDTGTIRSRLNDFCLDIKDGRAVLNPYQPGAVNQQWERKGTAIFDRADHAKCLDIADSNKEPKAKLIKYIYRGTPNQTWTFERN